jgi:chromosome segregation protein
LLLSKLELSGFKSFPNRITLRFDEGIMGVVGPNGCGKTNILDSIRWVLGEQRTSLLRAGKVEEVIFNGTTQLKAADMAEVSLTVKNNRGVLPLEYNEVEVTRRLYRSGESEYLLNKSRCRLKDITELFADTGMGIHAYSIFQQGMVDAVLSDKAEERRYLFEEAAGITKYKNRKKEALKKLDNTEGDLIRLSDIIAEIGKNVRSLRRQAAKARRYKKLKDELQQLEITRASARIYDFQQKIDGHETEISGLRTEKEGLVSQHDTSEAEIQELKLEINSLNEKISADAAKEADFSQQALKAENSLTSIQARLESGKKNVELWTADIDNLKRRIESLKEEKIKSEQRHSETSGELEDLRKRETEGESAVLVAKNDLDESASRLESIKERLHLCDNDLSTDRARLEANDNSIERLNSLNQDLDQTLSKFRAKKESSQENLQLQKDNLHGCENEIAAQDREILANQQQHLKYNDELEGIRRQLSSSEAEKSGIEARIEILSKMLLEHEGYGSGIKALFAWENKPDGIIDSLANLVTADKQFYLAVEAALNTYGQLVVCRNREDALKGIEFLEENSAGRVSFLVLESVSVLPEPESSQIAYESHRMVADLIDCQDYLKPAVEMLFGSIAVYETGSAQEDGVREAVDLSGRYYSNIGLIGGGKSQLTLVGRKSELADLQELLERVISGIEALGGKLDDIRQLLAKSADEAEKLKNDKKTLLNKRENLVSEMTRLEFEFQESVNRLGELQQNSTETSRQRELLLKEKSLIEEKISSKEREKLSIAKELEQVNLEHESFVSKYEYTVAELNQHRLKTVELTGLVHKLEDDIVRFGEMADEAENMIHQKEKMIGDEKDSWQEMENQQAVVKSQIAKLFEAKSVVEDEKNEVNNRRVELASKLNELENDLKLTRNKISDLNEQIHHQELSYAEFESSIKNIIEQAYHEYGVQISAQKAEDYDNEQVDNEIDRWRRILEKIGQVNMLADEEYTTEHSRLEFLEKQYADLQEAKRSLLEVISKINRTAEEKFSETFEMIKENFQSVFESLFEGGTAEIKLENPDDLLDSPIEIIARPGSKKLVSVNQLSGGERALTAISLLFAIYMVKPSPFCILDEIDAPLDDANVARFLKLINKFTHSTQFIVITHNKKTMEAADLLYGVTMERPGVSNIVSVKFNGNMLENAEQV